MAAPLNDPSFELLKVTLALLFVLGLLALLNFIVRKYGHRIGLPVLPNAGKHRRLQLVEILSLDGRHKLALVRRDQTEHLLLLGSNDSCVVEQTIDTPKEISLETVK